MTSQNTTRKSGAELPSASELLAILENESPRQAVKFDFLPTHNSIFDAYREVSQLADVADGWTINYPSMTLKDLVHAINICNALIVTFIMNNSHDDLYRRLYRSLIPLEDLSESEAVFVFGAASNARIERAIELYNDGVAPKIIISGQRPFYGKSTESEAQRMANLAMERGIPASALILEENSITLPDNVKRSIDLLESIDWRPSALTIVATNFVLQRALMDWYKFTPWNIQIKPVAARPQYQTFTEGGWYSDKETIALVLNEYAKLVLETKIDLLRRDNLLY